MNDLRLPMNPLTFAELVELARPVIPPAAPGWTDHNIHDPGIMLMELLAWIAEAQIYSLSRLRRDERLAYAHLIGEEPRGPVPARGLIWPEAGEDGDVPPPSWPEGQVLEAGLAVTPERPDVPPFFVEQTVALTTARLVRVESRFANGTTYDWTAANSRDGATFLPFGAVPHPDDRLALVFELPADAAATLQSPLSVGVEIVDDGRAPDERSLSRRRRLRVEIQAGSATRPVRLRRDTTGGFLTSGVLLLSIEPPLQPGSEQFTLLIRSATGGFLRAPRVQRIAVNVLPVTQREGVADEEGTLLGGQPDQTYALKRRGLMFPFRSGSFALSVLEDGARKAWEEAPDLAEAGPVARAFAIDHGEGVVHFGNGINGYVPPADSPFRISYDRCDGTRGNVPKGMGWTVQRVAGGFGANSAPMAGGADARGLQDLRAIVRERTQARRPIVTAADLENAARGFSDLGIARAEELTPQTRHVRGSRTLVIVGAHDPRSDEPHTGEPGELLAEVRDRLATRLPLGQRLEVVGPRYVRIRVTARLRATRQANPEQVERDVERMLRERLDAHTWPFGRDVTATAVKGWLRNVAGVAQVLSAALIAGGATVEDARVALRRAELPQYVHQAGDLTVERPSLGGTR